MKVRAIVCIKSDKSLTPNLNEDIEHAIKTSELYLFKRIKDAKAFFNQQVIFTEQTFFDFPFDKTEDKVDDFHLITYKYSFGGAEYTKEISFKKGD